MTSRDFLWSSWWLWVSSENVTGSTPVTYAVWQAGPKLAGLKQVICFAVNLPCTQSCVGSPRLSATWPLTGAGGLTFKMTQSRGWQVGGARFSSWTPANPPQLGAEDPKRGHSRGDSASEDRVLTLVVSMATASTLASSAHSPQNERSDCRMAVREGTFWAGGAGTPGSMPPRSGGRAQ